jgi:MbtH protein
MNDDSRESSYLVVVNAEEQYSVWPSDRDIPAGWTAEGTEGSKDHCLGHIGKTWTDMRPRSLRERMLPQTSAGS